jgi:hypothetical protein
VEALMKEVREIMSRVAIKANFLTPVELNKEIIKLAKEQSFGAFT